MSNLKKWKLLGQEDVSPSPWFPLEKRSYQLADDKIIHDYYITTLEDSAHVIAITKDKKIVLVRQYKPGVDKVVTQFPAGRFDPKTHQDIVDTAVAELEEETGILVARNDLQFVAKHSLANSKATEYVHCFMAKDVEFNSQQSLDSTEEIEVITATPDEVEKHIRSRDIIGTPSIANWYIFKDRFLD